MEEAPNALEEGRQATINNLKEINLGMKEERCPIILNASHILEEKKACFKLLTEHRDIFAWSYQEMPGLDPKIAVHHLSIKHGVKPIKQVKRRYDLELLPQITTEADKLIKVGFIQRSLTPPRL